MLVLVLLLVGASSAFSQSDPARPREVPPPGLRKTTLATWELKVIGAPFSGLSNEDAGLVLRDWLTNALLATTIFNVVDRDRMQAVLSEQQLASAGLAVDTGRLIQAGALLKVNQIVLGSFKNLGQTTEVDFKLLDVATTTYTMTLNYSLPFSSSIEVLKPEIERVVAGLASRFPVSVSLAEIVDERRLLVGAGSEAGIATGFRAVLTRPGSADGVAEGSVVAVSAGSAAVELTQAVAGLNLFDYEMRIHFASERQAVADRGRRNYESGRYAEAVAELGKAVEQNPGDTTALLNLARSAWKLGDTDRAVETYRRAAALRGDDATLLDELATALLHTGRLADLGRLTASAGTAPRLLAQGALAELAGDRPAARAAYERARQLDPAGSDAALALALLALEGGDRATTLSPPLESRLRDAEVEHDAVALTARARRHAARGEHAAAREAAERALALLPDLPTARLTAAEAAAAGGDLAAALATLEQGLIRRPDSWPLHRLRGRLLLGSATQGEAEQAAVAALERARELRPGDRETLQLLAGAYRSRGDSGRAVTVLREQLSLPAPPGGADNGPVYAGLAEALLEVGDVAGAASVLERCAGELPAQVDCRYRLGVLAVDGQLPGGLERARELLEPIAGYLDAALQLARAYERLGRAADAARLLRQCVDAHCAGWPAAQQRLGRLEAMMGRVTAAAPWDDKQVYVDLGARHGARAGERLAVSGNGRVLGELLLVEVEEQRALAKIARGSAPAGATVRLRPLAPRALALRLQSGAKGPEVALTWQCEEQPEVDAFVVQRRSANGPWSTITDGVHRGERSFIDRAPSTGSTTAYRVRAFSRVTGESAPSESVELTSAPADQRTTGGGAP